VHLDGGELEVEVGEDLHVNLTGWAVPVYRGELSDDFLEEIESLDADPGSPSAGRGAPRR
jgi:diaminopimelate epimerase